MCVFVFLFHQESLDMMLTTNSSYIKMEVSQLVLERCRG
jgi:hypothetical protein